MSIDTGRTIVAMSMALRKSRTASEHRTQLSKLISGLKVRTRANAGCISFAITANALSSFAGGGALPSTFKSPSWQLKATGTRADLQERLAKTERGLDRREVGKHE